MTPLFAALLAASITAAPVFADGDRDKPRPPRPGHDRTRVKRPPVVAPAVAAALDRRNRDIEVVAVGDVEDGAFGGSNVIELGSVSYQANRRAAGRSAARGARGMTVLKRHITVRIGQERVGFAPLRAHLQADDGRCRIRVDGKLLTAVPQMIDPLAPLGQAVRHVVEIEILDTASAGPVAVLIAWTSDAH
jgi:hypothetical protein